MSRCIVTAPEVSLCLFSSQSRQQTGSAVMCLTFFTVYAMTCLWPFHSVCNDVFVTFFTVFTMTCLWHFSLCLQWRVCDIFRCIYNDVSLTFFTVSAMTRLWPFSLRVVCLSFPQPRQQAGSVAVTCLWPNFTRERREGIPRRRSKRTPTHWVIA